MQTDEKTSPQMAFEVNVRSFDLNDPNCGKSVQLLRVVRDEDPRAAIIGAFAEEDCAEVNDSICSRQRRSSALPVDVPDGFVQRILRRMVEDGRVPVEPTEKPAPAAEAP